MRWWYLAAGAGGLLVLTAFLLDLSLAARPKAPACEPVRVAPLGPPATAGLVVTLEPGLFAEVDGHRWVQGARVTAGPHRFHIGGDADAGVPFEVEVVVHPFEVVWLEGGRVGDAVVVALGGASCTSCPTSARRLPAEPVAGVASLEVSARALSRGDWPAALAELAKVPVAARAEPAVARQLQALQSLSPLEPEPPAFTQAKAAASRAEHEARRQWLIAQWNRLTDRFVAVSRAFAGDAAGVVSKTSERVDALSASFAAANERGNLAGQEDVLEATHEVERALAQALSSLHPADCAWQGRVQAAFAAP